MTALFAPARLRRSFDDNHHNQTDDADFFVGGDEGGLGLQHEYLRSLIDGDRQQAGFSIGRKQAAVSSRVFCVGLPELGTSTAGTGTSRRGGSGYSSLMAEKGLGMAMVDESEEDVATAAETTAPSSPPDLAFSKSSKDSYDSSTSDMSSEHGDVSTEKLGSFDEVVLEDQEERERSSLEECNVKPESRPTLRRPTKRTTTGAGEPVRQEAQRPEKRYPSLKGAVTGALQDHSLGLPQGRGMRRGFTSPSSPSFMRGPQRIPSRSPSPGVPVNRNGSSPQLLSTTTGRSSWSAPSPNPNGPFVRRMSWQPGKKTAKQLEDEYDDGDDELPDEAILENIPIVGMLPPLPHRSPRMKTPSPQRKPSHPELHRLHSANVPKHARRPAAPTIMPNGQYGAPRSPRHGRPPMMPHSATVTSFPPEGFSQKNRSRSWAEHLNNEARELSAALDEYTDRQSTSRRNSATASTINPPETSTGSSSARPSLTKTRTKTSTVELPPLQKSNVLLDPLPISKEKEAVLTRTRPSWLPPKNQKEEKKHVKEWEQMMARSAEQEKKKAAKLEKDAETNEEKAQGRARIWEEHVLPDWENVIREPRTRELWWRGVSPESRAAVWTKAVGNELQLSAASYEAALGRAMEFETQIADMPAEERARSQEAAWFAAIDRDVPTACPDLDIFADNESAVPVALRGVLMAYAMYRRDVGYVYGTHCIAAVLCLHMRAAEAFVVLANLLNRPLPLGFLVGDKSAMASVYEAVLQRLEAKLPRLYQHLSGQEINLKAEEILEPMLRPLFARGLPAGHVSRVWDVFVFEGDGAIIRAAVAVLGRLESRLYGSRKEILALLGWGFEGVWDVGTEDEFMGAVRDAGKIDADVKSA